MTEERNETAGKPVGLAGLGGKYLTFRLANEEYGLQIMKVQEIIGMQPVTHVPRLPPYVRGIVNLRGRIIPTIELRAKFGLERVADTEKTCIIVVEIMARSGKVSAGIIVDEVAEVLDIGAGEVSGAPEFGANMDTGAILGVGIVKGAVKILLDVEKALTSWDAMKIAQAVA